MDLIAATSKLVHLSRSGSISSARRLFDSIPTPDTIAWNAMLSCYAQSGLPHQALALFSAMRASNSQPDAFSLTAALSAAAVERSLLSGQKLHAIAAKLGFFPHFSPVCNALVVFYGKCRCPLFSELVFNELESPNEVSWCSLLSSLVSSGWLRSARQVFDEMPERSSAASNTLIGGYAHNGELEAAVSLFFEMMRKNLRGDLYTFSLLVSLSSEMNASSLGFSFHGLIVKLGWISAVEVGNSVISFYTKISRSEDALKVFDALPVRTQVSWNAAMDAHMSSGNVGEAFSLFFRAPERNSISYTTIITGASRNGKPLKALELFSAMISCGFSADELSFTPVLQSCSSLSLLQHGMMIHCSIVVRGFLGNIFVTNGLINMYAKCGDIGSSMMIFLSPGLKDLVSWNSMILGMSLHGMVADAMAMYREMERRMKPDGFTVSGMLMGCSHGGMVEDGMNLVMEIGDDGYVMEMMDMVGRAGMDEMTALFGDVAAAEDDAAAKMVVQANEWCRRERWDKAEEVRRTMMEREMKKEKGCSWVEMEGKVEVFGSGVLNGLREKDKEMVVAMLRCLEREMRN